MSARCFTLLVMPAKSVSESVAARIVELHGMGLSYRRIAAHLDRKQVPPPLATTWSAATVRNAHLRAIQRRDTQSRSPGVAG